jgi:hypothetical protein
MARAKKTRATKNHNANGSKPNDAIALLKDDHRLVEELFMKYENARSKDQKQKLARQICLELIVHSKIEEEIFYPACYGQIEDDIVEHSFVEHDGAKVLIADLLRGSPDDDFYDAKVKVLEHEITHHVHEEEKRAEGMFAQARAAGLDMDALGAQLTQRKQQLKEMFSDSPPMPETMTLRATRKLRQGHAAL